MSIEILRTTVAGSPKVVSQAGICVEYGDVAIKFSEPRGYGESLYDAVIPPDSFAAVAQAMMHANPVEAIKAFGAAMQAGIPKPQDRWWPGREDL